MSAGSLQSYLMPRPPMSLSPADQEQIDGLLAAARLELQVTLLDCPSIPKWQLLCDLADRHGFMLHGTGDPSITLFEPRSAPDANPFGAQQAVYAASDGIWPMFYAVLDRTDPFSIHNACLRMVDGECVSDPLYFFSVDRLHLARRPFRKGYVYLLPGESFVRDSDFSVQGVTYQAAHWASPQPVRPIARVEVAPADFPFLEQMRSHDFDVLMSRIKADPDGFPWVNQQYEV